MPFDVHRDMRGLLSALIVRERPFEVLWTTRENQGSTDRTRPCAGRSHRSSVGSFLLLSPPLLPPLLLSLLSPLPLFTCPFVCVAPLNCFPSQARLSVTLLWPARPLSESRSLFWSHTSYLVSRISYLVSHQAILLGAVLLLGARRVFAGTMTGQQLTTFVFYTQFVTSASFDVGDQVANEIAP